MHRRVPAEALARILIARWQRMARSTLAAQQRRADISRTPQPPRAVRRLP
jgi:hypothetical protein